MKNLIIIGTGGFAREVFWHAHNSIGYGVDFIVKGFLEGNKTLCPDKYNLLPVPVLGTIHDYIIKDKDVFAIAIANSEFKEETVSVMKSKNASFLNLIHTTASVAPTAKLGEGIIICQYATVSANTTVGNYVTINYYSSLGHDACIGNFTSIMGHVDITGNVMVGTHCYFGSGARILPKGKIGNHVTVAAGSVVINRVKDGQTVFGIPARRILSQ